MIPVTSGLTAHLAQRTTTLAWLWLIERTDGQTFGFTSHDADITLGDVTYTAQYGITPSVVQPGAGLAVGNAEVQTVFYSPDLTEGDLQAGVWDHAEVRVRIVNWADLSQGVLKRLRGWLGEVQHDGFRFTAELRGFADLLNRGQGRIVSPDCAAEFGDSQCGVDVSAFTVEAEVTATTSPRLFTLNITPSSTAQFQGGFLVWMTGGNAGRKMEIQALQTSGVTALQLPMESAVSIGDTCEVTQGCSKDFDTCRDVYSNAINFRGMPDVPGVDRAVKALGQ